MTGRAARALCAWSIAFAAIAPAHVAAGARDDNLFASPRAAASESAAPEPAAFDPAMAAQLAHRMVANPLYRYEARAFDPAMRAAALDRFLDALDPERLLFAADRAETLRRDDAALRAAIERGDQALPQAIAAEWRTLHAERAEFVRQRLQAPDGLRAEGEWEVDRSRAPRPADAGARRALWQRGLANAALELELAGLPQSRVRELLDERERALATRIAETDADAIATMFIAAFVRAADPAGDFLPPPPTIVDSIFSGRVGVGLSLRSDGVFSAIHALTPGGPAAEAGSLSVGDRLIAIGDGDDGPLVSVVGLPLEQVVDRVRGISRSTVRLQVVAAGAGVDAPSRSVRLQRRSVAAPDDRLRARVLESGGRRIGVLDLDSFHADFDTMGRDSAEATSASRDIRRELERFRAHGVDAVLLDLRGNGGGSLREAVEVAGLFLGAQPVVQIREGRGRITVQKADTAQAAWTGPVAVLIDEASAAASEIVAAALRDHGRGLVLGTRSFGRGSVQSLLGLDLLPIARGRALGNVKITVAMLYRPNGEPLQGSGLEPDIAIGPPALPRPPSPTAVPAGPGIPAVPGLRPAARSAAALAALDAAQTARLAQDPPALAWYEVERARRAFQAREWLPLDPAARRALLPPPPAADDTALRLAVRVLADDADSSTAEPGSAAGR